MSDAFFFTIPCILGQSLAVIGFLLIYIGYLKYVKVQKRSTLKIAVETPKEG